MLRNVPTDIDSALRQVVEYRKSGLSLNHIVGCPLDCAYCVRHLFGNYDMKRPHRIVPDDQAVDLLTRHWAFRPSITPIQILNRATDPFLPNVKEHLFRVLEDLDRRKLDNLVLVITRWRVCREDVERLERLRHVRLTILVTWSGIEDDRIEPVDSAVAVESLKTLKVVAQRTKSILYWRPLVAGLNDSDEHLEQAIALARYADATVFTGLFHRALIRDYLRSVGVPDLYPDIARRKILPRDIEARILSKLDDVPIFRKTSCGVAYAHGVADYNGHYCIQEICDICPQIQRARCKSQHRCPTLRDVSELARIAELTTEGMQIGDRSVEVGSSTEEQRYFIQHALNYQVHDKEHPHRIWQHGRAGIGWT